MTTNYQQLVNQQTVMSAPLLQDVLDAVYLGTGSGGAGNETVARTNAAVLQNLMSGPSFATHAALNAALAGLSAGYYIVIADETQSGTRALYSVASGIATLVYSFSTPSTLVQLDILGLCQATALQVANNLIQVSGFYSSSPNGGGTFIWNAAANKNTANGGTIIDPSTLGGFDGTQATRNAYLAAQGTGSGTGCWIRLIPADSVYSPFWYGAAADGVTIDIAPVQSLFNTVLPLGAIVDFGQNVTYNFGTLPSSYPNNASALFYLNGAKGLHLRGRNVTVQVTSQTNPSEFSSVFGFNDFTGCSIEGIIYYDTSTLPFGAAPTQGANLVLLQSDTTTGAIYGDFHMRGCHATNVLSLLTVRSASAVYTTADRISGITVEPGCTVTDSWYAFNAQENGDKFVVGKTTVTDTGRCGVFYGISDFDFDFCYHRSSSSAPPQDSTLDIVSYDLSTKTGKIRISASGHLDGAIMALEHQPATSSVATNISNIECDISFHDVTNPPNSALWMVGYTGGTQGTVLNSNNVWNDIRVKLFGDNDLIAFVSSNPINFSTMPSQPFYLAVDAQNLYSNNSLPFSMPAISPLIVWKFSADTETRFVGGNATAAPVTINTSTNWAQFCAKVKTWMLDKSASLSAQNATYQEDILIGYSYSAGGVVQATKNVVLASQGTAGSVTYGGSAAGITVQPTGATYANSTAFTRIDVEWQGLVP